MEHLPFPTNGLRAEGTTVPYVCRKSYDGGPFLTYPIREGKSHVLPTASSTPGQLPFWQYEKLYPTPKEDLESFFQTWLFFGLTHEVLGDLCGPHDFIKPSREALDQVISTSDLLRFIDTWVSRVTNGDILTTYDHLAECLRTTYACLRAVGPEFNQQIKLSIASTGELLEYAVNKAFKIENLVMDNKCPASWRALVDINSWTVSMRAAGWCPSRIYSLGQGAVCIQSLYYFAAVHQPEPPGRHQSCSERECKAYQNNLKKYTTQHFTSDCQCEDLFVDVGAVDKILLDGQLPLLCIIPGQSAADLRINLISAQPDSRYVALSHVWADGLGNPDANALPRCQLLRLHSLLQRSNLPCEPEGDHPEPPLLWCDTLCCPVEPAEAKNRALLQMKRTYQDATSVLVLDASLQLCDSSPTRPEEMCARILSSGWTRRLWTLQEGALGAGNERLWFQFRDRAFNIRPLWLQVLDIFNKEVGRRGLAGEILNRTRTFTTFFNNTSDDLGADLAMIDAALRHRSFSVPTDEPLLVGNLLGLNIEKILDGPDKTRIHRMWSLMPSARRGIPKSIVFRLGPRLKEVGFRWAPSTLSARYEDTTRILETVREGDNEGVPSARGLLVSLSAYSLSFPSQPKSLPPNPWNIMAQKNLLYMRDEHGSWYLICRRKSSTLSTRGDFLTDEELCDIVHGNEDFRILGLGAEFQSRADGVQQTSTSLLVKLVQEEKDVNYVQSFMHLNVAVLQRISSEMFEAAYQCAQQLKESSPARQMANLRDGQVNMDLPSYKTLFDSLGTEIHRITTMEVNEAAVTASKRVSGRTDSGLFEAIMGLLFAGHFVYMGGKTKAAQRWCVD